MNTRCHPLAIGMVLAALGVGCGEGIAIDPTLVPLPPGSVSDGDRDASSADSALDASQERQEEPNDGSVVDRRADANVDGGRDGAGIDANGADTAPDVAGDAYSDASTDVSLDSGDVSLDTSSDQFGDASSVPGDASLDLAGEAGGDVGADIVDIRIESPRAPSDVGDAADGARDDGFDGCTLDCWPAADYYVDASATSGGDGSKLHPFKTITAAVQAHQASPGVAKKAYVAAGTYDESLGEAFPLVLRGLSLQGAGRDLTFIVGAGVFDHSAAGGLLDQKYMATAVVGDPTLPTRIEQISVRSVGPVPTENFIGVYCDRGDPGGQVASPGGQTVLDNVQVGPGYSKGVAAVASTQPTITGCALVITRSIVTGAWSGVFGQGCGRGDVYAPVSIVIGGDDPASGNTFSWMQGENYLTAGVIAAECVPRGSIQHNSFVDSAAGVRAHHYVISPERVPASHVSVKHNSFERLSVFGYHGTMVVLDELSDNRFVGISAGPVAMGGMAVALAVRSMHAGKIRRNQFIGNDNGLQIVADDTAGTPLDLGTVGDPGNNEFRCNSSLLELGADLDFYGLGDEWTGTLSAAGNAWDHVPPTVQRADQAAKGTDVAVHQGAAVTLDLSNATLSAAPCPDGRVPGQ